MAKMPPDQQAKVKAMIKKTILLRQLLAEREAVEFIAKLQQGSRSPRS